MLLRFQSYPTGLDKKWDFHLFKKGHINVKTLRLRKKNLGL